MRPTRTAACAILMLAVLAAPLPAAGRFKPQRSAPGMTITARPSSARPAVGTIMKVRVRIEGARGVGGVPFSLAYDPAVLEFLPSRSLEGPFLSRDGGGTTFLARAGSARDGRTAVVVGLSRLGGPGATGQGTLCELAFRVRGAGVSPLSFTGAQALDAAARPLAARFVGSSVRTRGAP
jgi:hypothetical protein